MFEILLLMLAGATAPIETQQPTENWEPNDHSMVGAVAGGTTATLLAISIPIILAATVGLDSWGPSSLYGNDRSQELGTWTLVGGLATLVPIATWAGHRLGGGRSSFFIALLGSTLGTLVGAIVVGLTQPYASGTSGRSLDSYTLPTVVVALAVGLPVTGSVFAIQFAHHQSWVPSLNVTPKSGGAVLSVGWSL